MAWAVPVVGEYDLAAEVVGVASEFEGQPWSFVQLVDSAPVLVVVLEPGQLVVVPGVVVADDGAAAAAAAVAAEVAVPARWTSSFVVLFAVFVHQAS